MRVRWVAADFRSGQILDDLRLPVEAIEQTVGQASQLATKLTVQTAPPDWETLLDPARTMIAALIDDGPRSVPILGYRIARLDVGEDGINLALASLEDVLDGIDVDDLEGDGLDEARVAEAIVRQKATTGWGFDVDVTNCGVIADGRAYTGTDQTKVAAALSDLMAVEGGPEWTIRLGWADGDQRRLTKTIVIAPRVGGDLTDTVVDTAAVTTRIRTRDAANGKLALRVTAAADGDTSPTYEDTAAIAAGAPPWETTVQVTVPDLEDDPEAFLARAGQRAYAVRRRGITTWAVTLNAAHASCPKVGIEFQAGDSLRMDLGPTWYDPASWTGMARLSGWQASITDGDIATVTPVLYDDRDQEDA